MRGPCSRFFCPTVGRLSKCRRFQTSRLPFGGLLVVLARFATPTTAAESPGDEIQDNFTVGNGIFVEALTFFGFYYIIKKFDKINLAFKGSFIVI